jgi:hypothetical protein
VKSGGGSMSHIGVYVGGDWYTHLSTYDDHAPILDISAGSVLVALGIAGRQVNAAAVEFARELASQGDEVRGRGRAAAHPATRRHRRGHRERGRGRGG